MIPPDNESHPGQTPLRRDGYVSGAHIEVERLYADVTYALGQPGMPISVENEVKDDATVTIDPHGYLSVFDNLYPKGVNKSDIDSLSCYLMTGMGATLKAYPEKVLLLPLIQQQLFAFWSQPDGTLLDASFGKKSYKILVAKVQSQTFFSFALFILLWCVTLSLFSGFERLPDFSSYSEIDIIGKLPISDKATHKERDLYQLHCRLQRAESGNVMKALRGVTLIVDKEIDGDIEGYEMENRGN